MTKRTLRNRKKEFWKKFENSIFEVIHLALDILNQKPDLPQMENDLNRVFYNCLVEANYRLQQVDRGRESPPIYEARNQPFNEDETRAAREYKIPDFQWSITDSTEPIASKSAKQFVLECKRLGVPSESWVFNENYVSNGVQRFISEEHGYALGVESAAMLGYMQSMQFKDIFLEVNTYLAKINCPSLTVTQGYTTTNILSHNVIKEYSDESLRLEHFWVDLRKFY